MRGGKGAGNPQGDPQEKDGGREWAKGPPARHTETPATSYRRDSTEEGLHQDPGVPRHPHQRWIAQKRQLCYQQEATPSRLPHHRDEAKTDGGGTPN
jgi:hypothetical protein